ncbi:hypothetical protein AM592_11185 [Bacillus gobiensis]|uniref:Uncharacterized protein n=1 Tax=Bacillus gobiensis TaxID=1441095 RepID=A0A0M4G9M1_9BACI|nr:hypothetical protein AM592_11185 [Bacillus gobiensis]
MRNLFHKPKLKVLRKNIPSRQPAFLEKAGFFVFNNLFLTAEKKQIKFALGKLFVLNDFFMSLFK